MITGLHRVLKSISLIFKFSNWVFPVCIEWDRLEHCLSHLKVAETWAPSFDSTRIIPLVFEKLSGYKRTLISALLGGSYEKIMLTIPNDEKFKFTQHLGKHKVSNAVYLRCCSLLMWALYPVFLFTLVCTSESLQLCMACKSLSVHFNSAIGISEAWTQKEVQETGAAWEGKPCHNILGFQYAISIRTTSSWQFLGSLVLL